MFRIMPQISKSSPFFIKGTITKKIRDGFSWRIWPHRCNFVARTRIFYLFPNINRLPEKNEKLLRFLFLMQRSRASFQVLVYVLGCQGCEQTKWRLRIFARNCLKLSKWDTCSFQNNSNSATNPERWASDTLAICQNSLFHVVRKNQLCGSDKTWRFNTLLGAPNT